MPLRLNNQGMIVHNNGRPWRPSHAGLLSRRHPHPRRHQEITISRANAARILAIRRRMNRLARLGDVIGVNINFNSNANNNYNVNNQNPARRELARERRNAGAAYNALSQNLQARYGVTFGHPAIRAAETNAYRQQQNLLRRGQRRIVHRFVPGRRQAGYLTATMRRLGFDPLVRLATVRQYIRSARGRLA